MKYSPDNQPGDSAPRSSLRLADPGGEGCPNPRHTYIVPRLHPDDWCMAHGQPAMRCWHELGPVLMSCDCEIRRAGADCAESKEHR